MYDDSKSGAFTAGFVIAAIVSGIISGFIGYGRGHSHALESVADKHEAALLDAKLAGRNEARDEGYKQGVLHVKADAAASNLGEWKFNVRGEPVFKWRDLEAERAKSRDDATEKTLEPLKRFKDAYEESYRRFLPIQPNSLRTIRPNSYLWQTRDPVNFNPLNCLTFSELRNYNSWGIVPDRFKTAGQRDDDFRNQYYLFDQKGKLLHGDK